MKDMRRKRFPQLNNYLWMLAFYVSFLGMITLAYFKF